MANTSKVQGLNISQPPYHSPRFQSWDCLQWWYPKRFNGSSLFHLGKMKWLKPLLLLVIYLSLDVNRGRFRSCWRKTLTKAAVNIYCLIFSKSDIYLLNIGYFEKN